MQRIYLQTIYFVHIIKTEGNVCSILTMFKSAYIPKKTKNKKNLTIDIFKIRNGLHFMNEEGND